MLLSGKPSIRFLQVAVILIALCSMMTVYFGATTCRAEHEVVGFHDSSRVFSRRSLSETAGLEAAEQPTFSPATPTPGIAHESTPTPAAPSSPELIEQTVRRVLEEMKATPPVGQQQPPAMPVMPPSSPAPVVPAPDASLAPVAAPQPPVVPPSAVPPPLAAAPAGDVAAAAAAAAAAPPPVADRAATAPGAAADGKLPKAAYIWETAQDGESRTDDHLVSAYVDSALTQEARLDTIRNMLSMLVDVFDANGIEYWLTNGALLGSFRGNDLIEWDTDADIALTFEAYSRLVAVVTNPSFRWADPRCMMIFRKGIHAHVIPFKLVNTSNGVYIDSLLFFSAEIVSVTQDNSGAAAGAVLSPPPPSTTGTTGWPVFRITKDPGVVCYWPYSCAACTGTSLQAVNNIVYPLRNDCKIRNRSYKCPAKTEDYLKLWYYELAPRKY